LISLDKVNRSRQDRVWIGDEDYLIHTDFCYWISFGKIHDKIQRGEKILLSEFNYLYNVTTLKGKDYGIPENIEEGYRQLVKFYINEQPLPKDVGRYSKVKTLDWDIDSERICEVFLREWGIDLETTDMHWHRFQGLLNSYLYNLDKVMEARLYEKKDFKNTKKYLEYENQIKKESREMWSLESLNKKEPFKMR